MNNPPLDELMEKVDCKYTLSVLAAKRARDLMKGAAPYIASKSNKPVTIALEEINQGQLTYERTVTGIK